MTWIVKKAEEKEKPARFYVDGKDVTDLDEKSLRELLKVANNLTYFKPKVEQLEERS
jgi:hypothetical protein